MLLLDTKGLKEMNKIVIGIVAHVDAGKTSLSECLLYESGKIRSFGRVDNKDAYLDTFELERQRGITIFSKQAVFEYKQTSFTLLDTPGHVDFSAEMERTLQVLDYAILVISGADGVQGHTKTLWRLLQVYKKPCYIFVNKMDQPGVDKDALLADIKKQLSDMAVPFELKDEGFYEQIALSDESVMEDYLQNGHVSEETLKKLILGRKIFPVFFGSALKQHGIQSFMEELARYAIQTDSGHQFGAKVFKISRDAQGNRLTHLKVTSGRLLVKDLIDEGQLQEKVNQIRRYSGEKFETLGEANSGDVIAVLGLSQTYAGQGLGVEATTGKPLLEPVLSYRIHFPNGEDTRLMLPKLRLIEEEEPSLKLVWDEILKELHVELMGEVQLEVLQALVLERFNTQISFGEGHIVYKETIATMAEGVGHFEPLRHYAEVHLLLEPMPRGSGLVFKSLLSEDELDKNWQRLILSHLNEKEHRGVLTGSYVTDMRVSLVAGGAHLKHTDGGDFREATFRALRQGLMEAESLLLEPYYQFTIEVPSQMVGRTMTDIEQIHGSCEIAESDGEYSTLVGKAPVATMRNYHKELVAYTRGFGRITTELWGYDLCHNTEYVMKQLSYDPERDILNPTGSVFCQQGAGYYVPWHEVKQMMHLEGYLKSSKPASQASQKVREASSQDSISLEEIDAIMNSTFYANQGKKDQWKKRRTAVEDYYQASSHSKLRSDQNLEQYLLVDGYNIIFSWTTLNELAKNDLEGARKKLLDLLSHYKALVKTNIMVVFDAYKVEGRTAHIEDYGNIQVVFTAEAQTADQYIEKYARTKRNQYKLTVATSDGLQQVIIRGAGCELLSARDLEADVKRALVQMREEHLETKAILRDIIEDHLDSESIKKLKERVITAEKKVTPKD